MRPERKQMVEGKIVEEFYWAGRLVVYVDYVKSPDDYEMTIAKLEAEARDRRRKFYGEA